MTGGEFDIVLFGYRNELARERVLAYLAGVPPTAEGPSRITRETVLPERLFAHVSNPRAQQLCDALERYGAQITLVDLTAAPVVEEPARRWFQLPISSAALLVVAIGGVLYVRQHPLRPPITLRLVRRPETAPVAAPTVPVRHAVVQPIDSPPSAPLPSSEPLDRAAAPVEAPSSLRAAVQLNAKAAALADHGQLEAAADRLREALRLAPDHAGIRHNLREVLIVWGLRDARAAHVSPALEHLQEALSLADGSDVHQALGMVSVAAGNYGVARDELEQAAANGPMDPEAWVALAHAYVRLNDHANALATLQRAQEAGVYSADLAALSRQMGQEASTERDFSELRTEYFRITFAEGENRIAARVILSALADVRAFVGRKLDHYPTTPTDVVLYARQEFLSIKEKPIWVGGLYDGYDGRIKIPVRGLKTDQRALTELLRHEYAHRVIAELSANRCPRWLHEGVAVWAAEESDGERRAWAEDILRRVRSEADDVSGPEAESITRVRADYARSYLAVRNLIDRYGPSPLREFLAELGREPFPTAFESVYRESAAEFTERWLQSPRS